MDRAVALPGGGTSSHPCQDMSPTCWLEPSLTDSVAAEVLGRPSARSAAAADVDGMSRGRWPGAGGSSEDAEGLAEQRPPGLAPRGGLRSAHAVLARPTRAWAERATAWRQDTSSPTGAGTPLPQLRRKLDLPVVQGAGRRRVRVDGARAVTCGAPPSGAARGSPNPVARQQVRHIPQPSAATPPTAASLLGPRGWGLGTGDPAPRLPCLKNQESGRQRFRVARDRALGGRCVPAACRRPC